MSAALGEPNGDYPSHEERVVLYATNKARTDPSAEGWASYPAQPPMQYNYDLNRSSRAHSADMAGTPCFQHPSCDGTDTFVRIKSYYTGTYSSMAENIAAGTNITTGTTVVHNWINEIGAAAGETGHRDSIFSKSLVLLGSGYAAGGPMKNYWTQDFVGKTVTRVHMADGIHFPKTASSGAALTFGTTFYDSTSASPSKIAVVVDGTCHTLSVVRGTASMGAYEAALSLADGCHPYYFLCTVGGADFTYPDTGSLQAGVGASAASCGLFVTSRVAADCTGAGGAGGSGSGGSAGAGGGSGGSAGSGNGGSTSNGGATGNGGASGNGGAGGVGGSTGAGGVVDAGRGGAGGASGSAGAGGALGSAGAGGASGSAGAGGASGSVGSGGASGSVGSGGASGASGGSAGASVAQGGGGGASGAVGAGGDDIVVMPPPVSTGGGDAEGGVAGASAAPERAKPDGSLVGSCSCDLAGRRQSAPWSLALLAGTLMTLRRRRRRSTPADASSGASMCDGPVWSSPGSRSGPGRPGPERRRRPGRRPG